jgi:hypothetical protein
MQYICNRCGFTAEVLTPDRQGDILPPEGWIEFSIRQRHVRWLADLCSSCADEFLNFMRTVAKPSPE